MRPCSSGSRSAYGVDRYMMLGLWGMECAFGDVIDNPKHMRPVFPALAALAWGEPRRRAYWEQELLNALVIVERGWGKPDEMVGSWAGAMGHTPVDAGSLAQHGRRFRRRRPRLAVRAARRRARRHGAVPGASAATIGAAKAGATRCGLPAGVPATSTPEMAAIATWVAARRHASQRQAVSAPGRAGAPVAAGGGRAGVSADAQNFEAVKSYNPANTYALAIVHLGDRIRGDGPFVQPFPGGERILTLEEVQEVQQRPDRARASIPAAPTAASAATRCVAVRDFQTKAGLAPADGYPGLKVLAKLRAE